jgi:hypothetical protein
MFQHFFGKCVENIPELILPVGIFGWEAIPQTHVGTNKGKITPHISLDNNPLPVLFDLAQKGHTPLMSMLEMVLTWKLQITTTTTTTMAISMNG